MARAGSTVVPDPRVPRPCHRRRALAVGNVAAGAARAGAVRPVAAVVARPGSPATRSCRRRRPRGPARSARVGRTAGRWCVEEAASARRHRGRRRHPIDRRCGRRRPGTVDRRSSLSAVDRAALLARVARREARSGSCVPLPAGRASRVVRRVVRTAFRIDTTCRSCSRLSQRGDRTLDGRRTTRRTPGSTLSATSPASRASATSDGACWQDSMPPGSHTRTSRTTGRGVPRSPIPRAPSRRFATRRRSRW